MAKSDLVRNAVRACVPVFQKYHQRGGLKSQERIAATRELRTSFVQMVAACVGEKPYSEDLENGIVWHLLNSHK
jgi:hypothetical protein